MTYDKNKESALQNLQKKNPKWVIRYGTNGTTLVRNPNYDPSKCEKCGRRKWLFHFCR